MTRQNSIDRSEMATDKSFRIHRANRELKCPLAQKSWCQRVQWCHAAILAQKEIDRARRSGKEISMPRRLGDNPPTPYIRVATPPSSTGFSFWRLASKPKTLKQLQGYVPARCSTLPNHARVARLLRVSLLQVLEFEESLWRVRCWLLRSCIGSFLNAFNKAKQYITSGGVQS